MAVSDEMMCEMFDRMREQEATNREQNAKMEAIVQRLDTQASITDKYFEAMDTRGMEDRRRFDELMSQFEKREQRTEGRERNFWKAISILIGAVIVLGLGPKVAEKVFSVVSGPSSVMTSSYAIPMTNHDLDKWRYLKI